MKTLNTYISERLNPRNLGPGRMFPIGESVDETEKFLENNKFKKIPNHSKNCAEMIVDFNEQNGKSYLRLGTWIRFADTSKENISEDNPVFYYQVTSYPKRYIYYIETSPSDEKELSKEEFLKLVIKHLKF